jgi:hypothetical protein
VSKHSFEETCARSSTRRGKSLSNDSHDIALETEIFKERAAGLGIAGGRLQKAIREYERHVTAKGSADRGSEALLQVVAEKAYELLVQRELNGLVHENVEWLAKSYRIPESLMQRLGLKSEAS